MSTDLKFRGAWSPPSGRVDLAFGASNASNVPDASARLSATMPTPIARLRASYDVQVTRPFATRKVAAWQRAAASPSATAGRWGLALSRRVSAVTRWEIATTTAALIDVSLSALVRQRNAAGDAWTDAPPMVAALESTYAILERNRHSRVMGWDFAQQQTARIAPNWDELKPRPRSLTVTWQRAVAAELQRSFPHHVGRPRPFARRLPWEIGRTPSAGRSSLPIDPPDLLPPLRLPPIDFNFACPLHVRWAPSLRLNFTRVPCGGQRRIVPALRVYLMTNDIQIVRLPGREPVPATSLNLSIDADSWAWGFNATLPASALPLIEPTAAGPTELEVSVNGITWIVLAERFDLRREFGSGAITVYGRSRAAWLAEPYAPARSFAATAPFTARQLAEQELDRAGLSTGFALDWALPDWLVPQGAWSYQALTPLSAILRIVESVGGTLNAHPRELRLAARSRYPAPPWQWTSLAPDLTLPLDAVRTLELRWQEKPAYNAVFVAGERHGLVARVLRSGSAGDLIAPTAVDALITHADAARERGMRILADTGRQALVTLELPMLPTLGLCEPGQLVAVGAGAEAWRGLVRATQIAARWDTALSVRQTIELERHH
jgi:hypothetical protein